MSAKKITLYVFLVALILFIVNMVRNSKNVTKWVTDED